MEESNCIIDGTTVVGFRNVYQKELIVPEGIVSIKKSAFSRYYGLERIILPSTLKSIEQLAFHKCTSLRSIRIPHGVESIGTWAFERCTNLLYADLQESQIKEIPAAMFSLCEKLECVFLPNRITRINFMAFSGCENIRLFNMPLDIKIIESIPCSPNIKILCIPDSVIHIEEFYTPNAEIIVSKKQYEKFKRQFPKNAKISISKNPSFDYTQENIKFMLATVDAYEKQADAIVKKWQLLATNSEKTRELVDKHKLIYEIIDCALGHLGATDGY